MIGLNQLDGDTAVLIIIGDPVAQVKAPRPLTELLQRQGFNAVLVPMHVAAADVPGLMDVLLRVRNVAGVIVTVPHKQQVASLVAELSKAGREAGAVNLVRKQAATPENQPRGAQSAEQATRHAVFWQADLQDGTGFVAGLARNGFDVNSKRVAMVGAGGAGNAIAFALAAAGAAHVAIRDVDARKQADLIARLQALGYPAGNWDGAPSDAQLLVNATPMGMRPDDPLPIAAQAIHAGVTVAEVIMQPRETALLNLAQGRGAKIIHGHHMMDEQLGAMLDFFAPAIRAVRAVG